MRSNGAASATEKRAGRTSIPLVDLSTPGNPAVQLTFIQGGNLDQLTIFGATLAQLNAGNVLVV